MSVLPSSFSRLLIASTIAALSACGGGGGGSSDSAGPTAGAQTGTLTDSVVTGIQYTTSAGFSGTTNAQGHFKYNSGETVTFKLGSLTLGTITATGTVATITPIELATAGGVTNQDKVLNLLVLLQSLDSDGDASNGITIPSAVTAALTSTVAAALDLTQTSTTFASSGNSTLTGLITAAGGNAALVTIEDAQAHFTEEFFEKLTGTWHYSSDANDNVVFRFDAYGNYFFGQVGTTDLENGQPGIEQGTITWNPLNGVISASNISVDTNLEWGLSHPYDDVLSFTFEGDTLVITINKSDSADEVIRFSRVQPATTGLVGTWGVDSGIGFNTQQFIFLSNGKYFMLDPIGDQVGAYRCGEAGIEYGRYDIENGTLFFVENLYDTNGCVGMHVDDLDEANHDTYAAIPTSGLNNETGTFTLPPVEDEGVIYNTTLYRAGVDQPL